MNTADSMGTMIGYAMAAILVSGVLTLVVSGVSRGKLTRVQLFSVWGAALALTIILMAIGLQK